MNKLATVGKSLQTVFNTTGLRIKKYSPEILMVAGITGVVGAAVLACRATLKCEELILEHDEKMEKIEDTAERAREGEISEYSEEDYKKDVLVVKVQTGVNFVKLYGPSVTLGVASIACILGAHNILKKRNVAIMAAYKLVEQSFAEYRDRVKAELGDAKDFHFRYGTKEGEEIETVIGEDGKKTKVKKQTQELDGTECSMYARLFEPEERLGDGTWTGSSQFSPVHHYNYAFLTQKLNFFNDQLHARGYLFLSEVYEELGFTETKASRVVGWAKNNGDGYVSFGEGFDFLAYKDGDPILLDFNVDGVIWDLI